MTTRPLRAAALLRTAEKLAGAGAPAGRPAIADLRRATSTAYYAVFHEIARNVAEDFLPEAGESEIAVLARSITHTGILSAAQLVVDADSGRSLEQLAKAKRPSVLALRTASGGALSADLALLADAVRTLQEARHGADYDADYDPVRAVTLGHVQDARSAVAAAARLVRGRDSTDSTRIADFAGYRTFLRLTLLQSGGLTGR